MPAKNLYRERKEGIYAHIYNKGVENRAIFNDKEDYESFQAFLKDYLTVPQDSESIKKSFTVKGRIFRGIPHQPKNYFNRVELLAFSLMPDHFHLLLQQKTSGSLESFIRSLCTRYSMYFNKKYQHAGALFEGPYRSFQTKDKSRLPQLTRYFHYAGGYSSYEEYLGLRKTPWVKAEAVLSFFDNGSVDYKNFVEKYEPSQRAKNFLQDITFETETEHLEGRGLTRNTGRYPPETVSESSEKVRPNSSLRPWQRIPELLAVTAVFCLLLAFGIRNVIVSTAKSSDLSMAPTILSTTAAESASPSISPSASPSPSPAAVLSAAEEVKPKMILTVKVDGAAATVNIREQPTVNSRKIGLAKNGDIFEFIAENEDWYEVKLATRSGFISSVYAEVKEDLNE